MPSTPPPSYSEALQDDKRKLPIESPYSKQIFVLFAAGVFLFYILFFGGFLFNCSLSSSKFRTCSPTERLEPCEFVGKLSFAKIYAKKKEINENQKKINEITNVMKYGLSTESSKTLLQKQNSFNETLEKLLEKFNYQKTHFEKCYFDNYKINQEKATVFFRNSMILFSLILIFCFLTASFCLRKVPPQLNEEETESYKKMYTKHVCCFIFTIGILSMIFTYIFVNAVEKFDEISDIPIFVAEAWNYGCSRRIRTAEEFVSRRSYDKNFH